MNPTATSEPTPSPDVDWAGGHPSAVGASPGSATGVVGAKPSGVTDRLFGRDLIYVLLWGAQMGLATLLTPVFTRLLGPVQFGTVAAAITVMQLLVAVGTLGLQSAMQREYAHHGDERARRLLVLAVGFAVALFAVADLTGRWWSPALGLGSYRGAIRYAVMWAGCTAVTDAGLALMRSRDQLRAFALVNFVQTAASQVVSLLMVLLIARTASEYLLGQFLSQAGAAVIALAIARPVRFHVRRDFGLASAALRYSLPLVPAALSTFVLSSSDRLVVQRDLGSVAVAHYAVANNIGSITVLLLSALAITWTPRFLGLADPAERDSLIAASRDGILALLGPVMVGFGVAAPLLLRLWAPAGYRQSDSDAIIVVITAAAIPYTVYSAQSQRLAATGATLYIGISTLVGAVLNLGMNVVLVPRLGVMGSALSTLTSYGVMYLVYESLRVRTGLLPRARASACGVAIGGAALAYASVFAPDRGLFLVGRALVALMCVTVVVLGLAGLGGHPVGRWVAARLPDGIQAFVAGGAS